MKIDLEFVELHGPLFITHGSGGTNFGQKLYIDQKKNLKGAIDALYYDTDLKHTVVEYKGKVALIENVSSMTLKDPTQLGIEVQIPKVSHPIQTAAPIARSVQAQVSGPLSNYTKRSAQVSTPIDKVQGTPGRKAKFQGQESQGE